MRYSIFSSLLVSVIALLLQSEAQASCQSGRTELNGQTADAFFTTAGTKTSTFVFTTALSYKSNTTCSVSARSRMPGISVSGIGGTGGKDKLINVASIPGFWKSHTFNTTSDSTASGSGIVELVDRDNDVAETGRVIGTVKVYVYKKSFPTTYVHWSTSANAVGDYTLLDHPYLNGNPSARILVTHNFNPPPPPNPRQKINLDQPTGSYDNKVLGVWYSAAYAKWAIFHQDRTTMAAGLAFNIHIDGSSATGAPIQIATAGNTSGAVTYIDNPITNNNPNAIVIATPNWDPPGSSGQYNNHNTIMHYYPNGKWGIENQDGAAMPLNAAFNLHVFGLPNPTNGATIQAGQTSDVYKDSSYFTLPATNGTPSAMAIVTPTYNPDGGAAGTYNNHVTGVWYDSSSAEWAAYN
jgi:hypothetical protein